MHADLLKFKQYWSRFSNGYPLQSELSQALYQRLYQAYTEPHRYYHTMQHIVECLDLFDQVRDQLEDALAVEVAIWFHDIVYQPRCSDNEQQSAKIMQALCVDFLSVAQLEKVSAWIKATQKHLPSSDSDLQYLLDIDLAILASSTQRFQQYEQQIHLEYQWVEVEVYLYKRRQVLKGFYQQQPIYQSTFFYQKLEQCAKLNLAQALEHFN